MTVDGALEMARTLGVERLDATVLLAHHVRRSREWLLAHGHDALDDMVLARFEADCRRRRDDVPLTVLGEVRGRSLVVGDLIDVPVETARERWRRALERRLAG